jgi:hypothetical protein
MNEVGGGGLAGRRRRATASASFGTGGTLAQARHGTSVAAMVRMVLLGRRWCLSSATGEKDHGVAALRQRLLREEAGVERKGDAVAVGRSRLGQLYKWR